MSKRDRESLRVPATPDPVLFQTARHVIEGQELSAIEFENYVAAHVLLRRRGRRDGGQVSPGAFRAEVDAVRAEFDPSFNSNAQPLPVVRFSQAGVASVRGGAA